MNGVYTNLAKKRVEQSKEPGKVGAVPLESLITPPSKRKQPPLWVQYYQAQRARIQASCTVHWSPKFVTGVCLVLLQLLIATGVFAIGTIIFPLPSWLAVIFSVVISPFLYIIALSHMIIAKNEWNTPILKTLSIYVVLYFFFFLIYDRFFF